ncbi:MAG: hypothetical protein WAV82_13790, partial [Methylobacter sp.]
YNFNLKLRAIGRIPPFEAIRQWFLQKPDIFSTTPDHLIVGLNSYFISSSLASAPQQPASWVEQSSVISAILPQKPSLVSPST